MLIRFKVKNFLSFGTDADGMPVELSMTAGKVRQKKSHIFEDGNLKLLKLAAVYGANASGKSNLVRAMLFMKQTVTNGKLPDGSFAKYCKSDASNKDRESYFEVEIRLNDKYYAYGFEAVLSRGEFVSEWLVELRPDGGEKVIFSRDIRTGDYDLTAWEKQDNALYKRLDIYAGDIQNDSSALFLHVMNQNKGKLYHDYQNAGILRDVYLWMKRKFDIVYPEQPVSYKYVTKADQLKKAQEFLSACDTGISELHLVEVPEERVINRVPYDELKIALSPIQNRISERDKINISVKVGKDLFFFTVDKDGYKCKSLQLLHGNPDIPFELNEESDGTVRLLDLLEILITGEGKTFVVDELDRCLHPSLTYKFIQTYLKVAAKRDVQLIVTTHESRLMDFDLLRRDEIWFAEKSQRGETQLYSLEEFNTRHDQKIDKAYLEGQYGGVPIFNTVFPFEEAPDEN